MDSAATRIVGFFVAAMGMGLILKGPVEFLEPFRQVVTLTVTLAAGGQKAFAFTWQSA